MGNSFNPKHPYTGTGKTPPKGTSLPAKILMIFRDKSGKPIKGKVEPVKKPGKRGSK